MTRMSSLLGKGGEPFENPAQFFFVTGIIACFLLCCLLQCCFIGCFRSIKKRQQKKLDKQVEFKETSENLPDDFAAPIDTEIIGSEDKVSGKLNEATSPKRVDFTPGVTRFQSSDIEGQVRHP